MKPFLTIWTEPKKTLAYLIEHKTIGYGLMMMIIISSCSGIMAFADTGFLVDYSLGMIVVISWIAVLLIGIPAYFISAFVYTWIGKLLGGTGNWRKMCLVITGGALPLVVLLPIEILAVVIYGKDLFAEPAGAYEVTNMSLGFYLFYSVATLGLSIFTTVIQSKGIGLVHGFSAWRGFGTIMICVGIAMVIMFVFLVMIIGGILFMF